MLSYQLLFGLSLYIEQTVVCASTCCTPDMTENFNDLKSLSSEAGEFLDENLEKLGISRTGQLIETVVDKLFKRDLAPIAHWAQFYLGEYIAMTTDIDGVSSNMKSEMIALQKSVNKLQAELLTYKDNEVKELKSVVKSTVESSVKSEFLSYSSVLKKSLESSERSINKEELKNVAQNVVQEEDRSRNLMIFGLPEENSEDLNATVSKIFTEIGDRPRIDACRLGKKIPANSARPAKVTATSSAVVAQILS